MSSLFTRDISVVQCLPNRCFWQFFFEMTITGIAHLTVLEHIITPCINILFSDDDHYFQHDDAPLHYHADMRNFLNVGFPGQTGSVEFPP
jgi:hypothetical protein